MFYRSKSKNASQQNMLTGNILFIIYVLLYLLSGNVQQILKSLKFCSANISSEQFFFIINLAASSASQNYADKISVPIKFEFVHYH